MASDDGELSFILHIHKRGFWLYALVDLPNTRPLQMIVDTGSPASSLSRSIHRQLTDLNLLEASGERYGSSPIYILRNASIEGQTLPDLDLHVSNRATLLQIDGILGLDFLTKFRRITFDVEAMRMTLTT